MAVQILQPGRLAEAEELVVDEAILDVELVLEDVLHNLKVPGNTKANTHI
jgi:hypothetical protein